MTDTDEQAQGLKKTEQINKEQMGGSLDEWYPMLSDGLDKGAEISVIN